MNQAEVMQSQVAEVVLPSMGVLYGGRLPEGKVRVRPLTTREEKILISSRADVRSRLIHTIVKDCIIKEDLEKLPFDEYLVGDVVYLFLFIRSITYGPEYMFMPLCKYCQKPTKVEVRLPHDVGLYKMTTDTVEPFPCILPKSGMRLELRLFRIRDERLVDEYAKKHHTVENAEFAYRLARHIAKIDDAEVTDPGSREILSTVESLHALDAEAIRECVIDNDCGVDLQLEHLCGECGRPNEVYFEMTVDFFRSYAAKIRRRRGTIG